MQLEYVFWIYLTEIVVFNLDAHEKYYYHFSNYVHNRWSIGLVSINKLFCSFYSISSYHNKGLCISRFYKKKNGV
jgi:hypothetical protein